MVQLDIDYDENIYKELMIRKCLYGKILSKKNYVHVIVNI